VRGEEKTEKKKTVFKGNRDKTQTYLPSRGAAMLRTSGLGGKTRGRFRKEQEKATVFFGVKRPNSF